MTKGGFFVSYPQPYRLIGQIGYPHIWRCYCIAQCYNLNMNKENKNRVVRMSDKTWLALKKKKVASGYNWDRFLSKVELKK